MTRLLQLYDYARRSNAAGWAGDVLGAVSLCVLAYGLMFLPLIFGG